MPSSILCDCEREMDEVCSGLKPCDVGGMECVPMYEAESEAGPGRSSLVPSENDDLIDFADLPGILLGKSGIKTAG